MFGSVRMVNFRCFDDVAVSLKNKRGSLKPNVYLFGENSSGKTSFLLAFAFLKTLTDGYRINYLLKTRQGSTQEFDVHPFVMNTEVLKHFRKRAKGTMRLEYEAVVASRYYFYSVEFDDEGTLIYESLRKRLNNQIVVIYEATPNELRLGRNVVLLKDIEEIKQMHRTGFGVYTMLSYFNFILNNRKDVSLRTSLVDFVQFVCDMSVLIDGHYDQRERMGFFWNASMHPSQGIADSKVCKLIERSSPIINEMVQTVFPLVDHVSYHFEPLENGYKMYELYAYKRTALGIVEVRYDELPSGFRRFLDVCLYLLELTLGRCTIIDQFDLKLHQAPFLKIIQNIIPKLAGQSIGSLDALDAMNHLEPASIYVTSIDALKFTIQAIEDIAPSQPNHNIRNRYEQGVYGKPVPLKPSTLHNYLDAYLEDVRDILDED